MFNSEIILFQAGGKSLLKIFIFFVGGKGRFIYHALNAEIICANLE